MEVERNKYLVVGTGKSGIAATDLLVKEHLEVVLYNSDGSTVINEVKSQLLSDENVEIVTGDLTDDEFKNLAVDIMVVSPGVPMEASIVKQALACGIPVWSEVELAYRFGKGDLVAITGTNGKTTTTSLVGEIMKAYYENVDVVGNIGIPYTTTSFESKDDTVTVAEISSYQLETIHAFNPNVSAILNITPDHLDRHKTMENYIACKMNIAKNQDNDEPIILNYEDEILREEATKLTNKIVWFSSKQEVPVGVYADGDNIIYKDNGEKTVICNKNETTLVGIHNLENIMAAVAISVNMNVPKDVIAQTIKTFKAVPHRIEYVETIDDVIFYNDSKGTNTDASIKAIEAMSRPTILIAGGYDKKVSFDDWADSFGDTVKGLVIMGETTDLIVDTVEKRGFTNYVKVNSIEEAVEKCFEMSEPGYSVLLSPACASWDMFDSYEQRGDMFKELVRKHK